MNSRVRRNVAKMTLLALSVCVLGGQTQGSRESLAAKKIKVTLNKKSVTLKPGQSYKLKAKKTPAKAALTWKSSKKNVVSVNAKGKLKAKKVGKAKITVTVKFKGKKKKAVCNVKVITKKNKKTDTVQTNTGTAQPSPAPTQQTNTPSVTPTATPEATKTPRPSRKPSTPAPTPVKIEYVADYQLDLGDKLDIKTKVKPAEGKIEDYQVTTSNKYVAVVDESGMLQSKHIGKCLLELTSKADPNKKESYKLCVTDNFVARDGFNVFNEDIAHGEVKEFNYPSQYRESGEGHAKIYLPPNYDPENKKYNLLFCLHGGGQDESFWTLGRPLGQGGCHAQYILDTLYAEKELKDAIVVFPNGNIKYDKNKQYPNTVPNPIVQNSWSDCYLFEYEVIYDLLPFMEKNYPVEKGADHTAVCGLSMGCGEAIEIGLKHPDLFHYMGFFSAGPFASTQQTIVTTKEDAQRINDQIKLCFFITGQNDHMMDDSGRRFVNNCDALGMNSMFFEVKGTGHDDKCWDRALYAFMKYAFK